jgi:delta24(24(1))-sterol reductase
MDSGELRSPHDSRHQFTWSFIIDILGRTLHWGGKPLRMSGVPIYDHFMGVSLNPGLGPVDLNIFAEVRVPWVLLFLISLSGAVKQYKEMGRVTTTC